LPWPLQLVAGVTGVLVLWAAANAVYQVARKPTELFFPVSDALYKTPQQTWREYGPLFEAHSTPTMTPALLAALAQAESGGNPVARTYWRWRAVADPFRIYRPASSAVGMYQITDGTFQEAKRYCIRNHRVVEDGPWHDWRSCWFNALYMRVVPSHAIEMTAAYLDRRTASILERLGVEATLQKTQDLATVIHLCGAGAGEIFAKRGFQPAPEQRCGDHDLRAYLMRVNALKRLFERYAASVRGRLLAHSTAFRGSGRQTLA
jgi:hypothetical protein